MDKTRGQSAKETKSTNKIVQFEFEIPKQTVTQLGRDIFLLKRFKVYTFRRYLETEVDLLLLPPPPVTKIFSASTVPEKQSSLE
jgi:hypothetical protein